MRVLCLHGSGSNGEILRTQLSSIISHLSHFEFEFLDAPHECEPAPELKGIYPGPYYCWFSKFSRENVGDAVEYVQEIIEDEDEGYDCILGFSQVCASIAASLLAQQTKSTHFGPTFKFGIFICAALIPPSIVVSSDLARTMGTLGKVSIPTVHIIGKKDPCYAQSVQLVRSCDAMTVGTVYHDGGHDVPRDAGSTRNMVGAIERGVRLAYLGQ